jgi:hypothetical protein
MLKALVIILLTPLVFCLGVYSCTVAHVAAISHAIGG